MQMLYQMSCLRKHILKSKTYYVQVFEDSMILSEHKNMTNPKYVIQFNFETRIMWKNSENDELSSFGIYYLNRIKWFDSDHNSLDLLKMHISGRVFFGNISLFYESSFLIGSGASSKVCLVKSKKGLLSYAAKCISKKYLTQKKSNDRINRLQQEIKILQQIDHHNFVKLLEIYQGDNSYYLVTDYLEGDTLYNYIRQYPDDQLPSQQVREAIKTILIGLQYLEQQNIVHRDIKLENIMLAKQNDISSLKIIDFGLAIYENPPQQVSICGTPGYIAPEILQTNDQDKEYFTTKCDVFSAGVIFYKLLTKRTLFRAQNTAEIMEANKSCTINYQDIEFKFQKEILHLLKSMLDPNPKTRLLASQCLAHPYFSCKLENINILQEILDKATGFSGISQIKEPKETHSIGEECQAALVKRCNPTSYRIRVEQRKRTKSPRKYADFQFYQPSFCQMQSLESDGSRISSHSNKVSRLENILKLDSVIEEDDKCPQQQQQSNSFVSR